jgi:hypothetical protein
MSRTLISSGSEFESKIGYSRAVVDGDYVFASGTTGFNYKSMSISEDVIERCDRAPSLRDNPAALHVEFLLVRIAHGKCFAR